MSTQAQINAVKKFQKENLAPVSVRLTKEQKAKFDTACQILGTTKNAYLIQAVNAAIAQAGLGTDEK